MKLFIASTPKTGNVWLERLLASIYDLPRQDLALRSQMPPPLGDRPFVTHQHYLPTSELLQWGRDHGVVFLTTIRHPADTFVSLYHYVNRFHPVWRKSGWLGISPAYRMVGEAIDSPAVLDFLRRDFGRYLMRSIAWIQSEASCLVRYEDLLEIPTQTLLDLTRRLQPVSRAAVVAALESNRIERLRAESELLRLHCRRGVAGAWRDELGPAHQGILAQELEREFYLLGYPLPDEDAGPGPARLLGEEEIARVAAEAQLEACSKELGYRRREVALRDEEIASLKAVLAHRDGEIENLRRADREGVARRLGEARARSSAAGDEPRPDAPLASGGQLDLA